MRDLFEDLCRRSGSKGRVVISNESCEVDLPALEHMVDSLASVFRCREGGRCMILLSLPGGPHFTAVVLAALSTEAVFAPIPGGVRGAEAADYLGLILPDIVVVESLKAAEGLVSALDGSTRILSLRDPSGVDQGHEVLGWRDVMEGKHEVGSARDTGLPAEVAMIQFTSGSTSQPKGILLSQESLRANLELNREYLKRFETWDVYCPIPQFHAMGGAVMLEHLFAGSSVHVANRFMIGEELSRIRKHGCRAILASPNYFQLLLGFGALTGQQLPDLDVAVMGTAPVDAALIDSVRESMPDLEIHIRYGLSEAVGTAARLELKKGGRLDSLGLVGTPIKGIELAPGLGRPEAAVPAEVRVRGATNAIGEIQARNGWRTLADEEGFLSTGDLACLDEEGRIHLRGRSSTFIKSNGYRVSPLEVESALRSHADVREAVVLGIPDPASGERIVACLEPVIGLENPATKSFRGWCEQRLSPYKLPKEYHWVSIMPRTAAGKPDRNAVRTHVSDTTQNENT